MGVALILPTGRTCSDMFSPEEVKKHYFLATKSTCWATAIKVTQEVKKKKIIPFYIVQKGLVSVTLLLPPVGISIRHQNVSLLHPLTYFAGEKKCKTCISGVNQICLYAQNECHACV